MAHFTLQNSMFLCRYIVNLLITAAEALFGHNSNAASYKVET